MVVCLIFDYDFLGSFYESQLFNEKKKFYKILLCWWKSIYCEHGFNFFVSNWAGLSPLCVFGIPFLDFSFVGYRSVMSIWYYYFLFSLCLGLDSCMWIWFWCVHLFMYVIMIVLVSIVLGFQIMLIGTAGTS